MKQITCNIHNTNIIIYNESEENLFTDDNKADAIIFIDDKGNKKLKRFVIGKCDENCLTIKGLLK